ncbi:ribbon-helix-helix domain-containing protein [Enterovibrio paralichthyis]|uniref:ribbon-helix-helix domain-containing protein n=1 Tax=Enterovibrio paralichthyis TaxID=2853805 RepID=UPI0006D23929|nr:ribbon-helix-helix domain-containing protein [Enterovibrio paralichthyis]MBV7300352.1 ribbon-helix-helix domain-containing protein [Enterovibrio paralichthyis]
MCTIFAGQDCTNYEMQSRSIRLGGHSTSVRLERKFWQIIDHIASSQGMNTGKFLTTLYDEALDINGDVNNFASLLRCSCILYLSEPHGVLDLANAELCEREAKQKASLR